MSSAKPNIVRATDSAISRENAAYLAGTNGGTTMSESDKAFADRLVLMMERILAEDGAP